MDRGDGNRGMHQRKKKKEEIKMEKKMTRGKEEERTERVRPIIK